MKYEHLSIILIKTIVIFAENLFLIKIIFNKIKKFYFYEWKVSSFSDYYWFLYSNKHFTFINKYL